MSFCHLHLHTQYSLLDGANKISQVIKQAASLGQQGIAITDHGNMHGVFEFYEHCSKEHINPVIGCEIYVADGSRFEKKAGIDGKNYYHLTVLAKDQSGYESLCKLVSRSYREGFYYKPRVDHELLSEHSKGLIVLSGCLGSELSTHVLAQRHDKAESLIEFYLKNFGENFFFEIQPHPIEEQFKVNQFLLEHSIRRGVPLVATTDCHYCNRDDHFAQEILMCISTQKTILEDHISHDDITLYLKSREEMESEFGEQFSKFSSYTPKTQELIAESLSNSILIGTGTTVSFATSKHYMPKFCDTNAESDAMMTRLARDGLKERLNQYESIFAEPIDKKSYEERLDFELALIQKMGFSGYFLVVSDFIVWAKKNGVPVGPGRGSVAGSLVAFAIMITEVDPIRHKLLFERFLNPDRISLPDIDVDFCINGRDKVLKYVAEKYGKDRVAQICTFGTMKAKAVIKDVGRALGMGYAETDKIAQLIPPPRQGFDYPLEEALKMEPRLSEYAKTPEGERLINLCLKLEGLTRHSSTHAAGVVIGDRPLDDLLPMMVDKDHQDVTQFSMSYVEKAGLVKFDFLGLKTLSVINHAVGLISVKEPNFAERFARECNVLNDQKTFALLTQGRTTGVFQLESGGITEMTMRLKPTNFDDLVAILALYRPGPLEAGMVDHYINRKHGEAFTYLHPLMEPVLNDTFGIILYQEQIMELARVLAGYTLGEADLLRRAMGKKKPEEMKKQEERFLSGCRENEIPDATAEEIFSQMETFARYGFNRSHSAAYALISFQTAYLKAHYGVEFLASLMSFDLADSNKTLKNINECRRSGIKILPPSVNKSDLSFTVEGRAIRFGLLGVKGLGDKVVSRIIQIRKRKGEFKSPVEFVTRVGPKVATKKTLEGLIKSGALGPAVMPGPNHRSLFENVEDLCKVASVVANQSRFSLFDNPLEGYDFSKYEVSSHDEWSDEERLLKEREAFGFYITDHPVALIRAKLLATGVSSIADLEHFASGNPNLSVLGGETNKDNSKGELILTCGVVTQLKLKNTRKGDRYASLTLEDYTGTVESLVWPDGYRRFGNLLEDTEPKIILGQFQAGEAENMHTLIIKDMMAVDAFCSRAMPVRRAKLLLTDALEDSQLAEILEIIKTQFHLPRSSLDTNLGSSDPANTLVPLTVELKEDPGRLLKLISDGNAMRIRIDPEIQDKFSQISGNDMLFYHFR